MADQIKEKLIDFEISNDVVTKLKENKQTHSIKQNMLSLITQYNNYEYFCFVEGTDDPYFYGNINSFCFKNSFFRTTCITNSNEWKGKDGVLNMFYAVSSNTEKGKPNWFLPKCVFIVDKDYVGAKSLNRDINDMTSNKISVTKGYSFENYFLVSENGYKIFRYFNLSNFDAEKFIEKYCEFHNDLIEYIRCKSSTILVKTMGTKWYDIEAKKYKPIRWVENPNEVLAKYIFNFNFNDDNYDSNYYNKENLSKELNNLYLYLKQSINRKAKECYNLDSKKIALNINNVRGHEAFDFLKCYLLDVHNIVFPQKWTKEYAEIVHLLDVDMKFVNGKGRNLVINNKYRLLTYYLKGLLNEKRCKISRSNLL